MLHPPGLLQSVPLTPWQATVDSCLCWRLPNTHRQAWLSLLWGHCSFLLGPGEHKVLSVPSKSLCFPVLWKFCNQIPLTFKVRFPGGFSVPLPDPQVGKSVVGLRTSATVWELIWCNCAPVCELPGWWLYCGANGDFLQENLGHMPCHPGLLLLESLSQRHDVHAFARDTQTLKGASGSVFCGGHCTFPWVLVAHKVYVKAVFCHPAYLTYMQSCCSLVHSCPTLCDLMDCSTPGFPVLHHIPEVTQTHVSWVCDAIQPPHPLSSPSPAFSFPASGSFPVSWLFISGGQKIGPSTLASVLPMSIQDWFPLGLTGLISLQSKELSYRSSKASILWHVAFFMVQLSCPYVTTGKTIALTI